MGATNAQPLLFTTCAEILANCQVASLKDTIRRDMREVAEETSATAAARSLGMTTELAKREARITQLGSRIEDLQVQQCVWSVFPGHPFRVVSGAFSFPCPASGRTPKTECLRRQQLKRNSTSTPLSSRTLCVGFAESLSWGLKVECCRSLTLPRPKNITRAGAFCGPHSNVALYCLC